MFSKLQESRRLDTAAIISTSDNGFFCRERGLSGERRLPCEESMRNNLLLRFARVICAGLRVDALVSSTDIAPSILEIARSNIGAQIQRASFLPLLAQGTARRGHRPSSLIENHGGDQPCPWGLDADCRAIRTGRHKLIYSVQYPVFDELCY